MRSSGTVLPPPPPTTQIAAGTMRGGARIGSTGTSAARCAAGILAAALLTLAVTGCAEVMQAARDFDNAVAVALGGQPVQKSAGQTTAQASTGNILEAVKRKVAAGTDAQTLRQELSKVINGGCYEEDAFSPDIDCLSRAYAPAVVEDRLEAARFLLDSGVGVNQKSDDKKEPLSEVLGLLVLTGKGGIYSDYVEGEGLSKIAVLLVSRGANINGRVTAFTTGEWCFEGTPLGIAALTGSVELVSLLLEIGAKVNEPTKSWSTAFPESHTITPLKQAQNALEEVGSEVGKNKYQQIISMLKAAGGKLTLGKAKKNKGKKR